MKAFEHMFDHGSGGGCFDPTFHRTPERSAAPAYEPARSAKEQAVRTYDDPVDVRKGPADGLDSEGEDRPEQFLWRGRLWQVREVIAHWVETGAWWRCKEVVPQSGGAVRRAPRQREVWRVAAARGRAVASVDDPGFGVFDLTFDWADGAWRLAGSLD